MNIRHSTSFFSTLFALLFAAGLLLTGCSAGALTAPETQAAEVVASADAQAPQHSEDTNGGGGTTGVAGPNVIDEK